MSFILQIDTALKTACISLAQDGRLLFEETNHEMKDHGAFLQPAIKKIIQRAGISMQEIAAIAVCSGPGSYTGLRVGMASAKGLSYALNKPLITVGSLNVLAAGVIADSVPGENVIFCPMIDARRMEVYSALYDGELNELFPPSAVILAPSTFANWLLKNTICFFGDGASKFKDLVNSSNAIFKPQGNNSLAMSLLAFKKYDLRDFADNAYVEPLYLKEFFTANLPG